MRNRKQIMALVLAGTLAFSEAVYAGGQEMQVQPEKTETADKTSMYTVNFWSGSHLIVSQQIKNGSSAVAPNPLEEKGMYFTGWDRDFSHVTGDLDVHAVYKPMKEIRISVKYLYEDKTRAAWPYTMTVKAGSSFEKTINSPVIPGFVPDKKQVTIRISPDETGTEDIEETVTYTGVETTYTVRHMLESTDQKEYNEDKTLRRQMSGKAGAYTEAKAEKIEGFSLQSIDRVKIAADGSTEAEVKYTRNAYVLNWDCGKDTYIEPVYVKYGKTVPEPKKPVKPGYEFAGWSYTPALLNKTMPAADVTAKALWKEAKQAEYTVVYWKEKMPGSGSSQETQYDCAEVCKRTGETGTEITYEEKQYPGYEPDTEKSGQSVRITSDGKAVKNVYYKRRETTIRFMKKEKGQWKEDESLRITVPYGTDISEIWQDEKHTEYVWSDDENSSECYGVLFCMPAEDMQVYGHQRGSGNKSIVYYTENPDGTWHLRQKADINTDITEESKAQIPGFTLSAWEENTHFTGMAKEDEGEKYKGAWLKYTRNSYRLIFENCKGAESASLKFEAPLSEGRPDESTILPAKNSGTWVFDNWYTSPALEKGTEVDWDTLMPAQDVRIYAGWKKEEKTETCTVAFDLNGAPGSAPEEITTEKYTSVKEQMPKAPTWDEAHHFLGWYRDRECTVPFVESQQITRDYILYAGWAELPEYTYKIVCKDIVTDKEITKASSHRGTGYISVDAPALKDYIPVTASQNVRIEKDGCEVVFYYRKPDTWKLTVRYEDESGHVIPGFEPDVQIVSEAEKVVFYKQIPGYQLLTEAAVTAGKGHPEVVFVYKKLAGVTYKTEYYIQNLSDDGYTLLEEEYKEGSLGWTVSAEKKDYEHFHCVSETADRTGIVSKNLVIKVYYDRDEYTVTFADEDKTILGTEKIRYEGNAKPPKDPEKEEDAKYVYTFSGWNGNYEHVTKDETVTASYDKEKRSYKVKYRISGTLPENIEEHVWGEKISLKEAPKKEGYEFLGWTAENVKITENTFEMPAEDVVFAGTFEKIFEAPQVPDEEAPQIPEFTEPEKPYEKDFGKPEAAVSKTAEETKEDTDEEFYTLSEIKRQEEGPGEDPESIKDHKTPEGVIELENEKQPHVCCIRHILFLLLTLILELAFVHDQKQHQQRVFALRRAIERVDEDER